ncbi:Pentatricopeptide repeat-containing protein [Acorus calamus]|uniref:Pentatricopeptide repeat-containing protein n=1 Tax=Acorus calamus TaxID=4465 RepID=A0AAV9CYG8_ACOCL|nr:Pentatricopeptide repeat-containing protein [Acorus calamus]
MLSRSRIPSLLALNSALGELARGARPHQAISLYNRSRCEGFFPDNYTLPLVLKASGRLSFLRKGEELHCTSFRLGFESDVFVQNSLISMYSACGDPGTARRVFDSVPESVRDVVTWNSMISAYVQSGLPRGALAVYGKMRVKPDKITSVTALSACGKVGDADAGRKIHASVVVQGVGLDSFLGSSLIGMYARCGLVEDARRLFDRSLDKNVVCWTSMVSGYTQSGRFREAIKLFREMQVCDVKANEAIVVCVISACAHLGALDQGKCVHTYCEINGIEMGNNVNNALIDLYSKCGDLDRAMSIFHGLVHRDVFSWTVMICGLAMNGNSEEALNLFSEMRSLSEVRPNEVTFLGVLSACSHAGLVDTGYYYFDCMKRTYKLMPKIEQYGCMVDLLGRANLLMEAMEFIRMMPIKADVVIWRSLLFACQMHNVELAEYATSWILELEPRKCGVHVLLSNVYASASRWGDVKKGQKGNERSWDWKATRLHLDRNKWHCA